MKIKKMLAVLMTAAMTAGLMTGCGSSAKDETADSSASGETASEAGTEENEEGTSDLAGTKITFLNSKGEIQAAMEEVAEAFQEETGIEVEILSCGAGEVPYTKVTTAYNAGSAPTMSMLDTTDIVALAEEYALDLSDEKWVS